MGRSTSTRGTRHRAGGASLRPRAHGLAQVDRADDGFSLVEVVVAIGIFAVVIVLLSGMLAGGMRGVLLGKRREVAAQEATKTIELARSLSFSEIGLAQDDASVDTDPAIVVQGGVKSYLVEAATSSYEPIMWAATTAGHPFNPHELAIERGATSLTRYVYVTGVDTDGDSVVDFKRVTVRVTWDATGTAGPSNEIVSQTFIDESGLVPVTPAGAGGGGGGTTGLTPMRAETAAAAGGLSVRTARGDLASLLDAVLPTSPVIATLPTTAGENTLRAVSSIGCTGSSTRVEGATDNYGGHTVAVTADDDGATATPERPADQSWSGPPDAVNLLDDVDRVLVESTLGGSISCHASAKDQDGNAPTDDDLPYEAGTGSGPGTLTVTEDVTGAGLGSNALTIVGTTTASVSQSIDHDVVAGNREITGSASGTFGELEVLRIPAVFGDGLVEVGSFSYDAAVTAADGTPSQAPSVNTASGVTIKIYDPAAAIAGCTSRSGSYCVASLDPGAAGFTGFSASVDGSEVRNLGLTTLTYTVDVDVLAPSEDPQAGVAGPNGETTWQANYTVVAISATLAVDVTVLGNTVRLTETEVDLTLGTLSTFGCVGLPCA